MKRLLAWVALYCSEIVLEIVLFIVGFLFSLVGVFVSGASTITFIIVYTLFGGALLWLLYLPFAALFPAITGVVERINESKTGLRYTILDGLTFCGLQDAFWQWYSVQTSLLSFLCIQPLFIWLSVFSWLQAVRESRKHRKSEREKKSKKPQSKDIKRRTNNTKSTGKLPCFYFSVGIELMTII